METNVIEEPCFTNLFRCTNGKTIQKISLCSKNLTSLPENLASFFPNLTSLVLSDNCLKYLPRSLTLLKQLVKLILDRNCMRYLPITVLQINCLVVLKLSRNFLTSLPEDLANLASLEILDLSFNKLKEIPSSCCSMNNLKILDLTANCIKRMPECVTRGMRNLEILRLSRNSRIDASVKPASGRLKEFYLEYGKNDVKFPVWILTDNFENLEIVRLDGTNFKNFVFPKKLETLRVHKLSLQNCGLYDNFLANILSLTDRVAYLKAGNNNFSSCRNSFWEMPINCLKNPENVESIDFRYAGLHNISSSIINFSNLVKLDVSRNNLHWLSEEICQLKKLQILVINDNELSALPENIGRMTALRELRAFQNNLAVLPPSFINFSNLSYLDLYENDFENLPDYLQQMENIIGFDVDENFIDIKNWNIGKNDYEDLRKNLRNRYHVTGSKRKTGRKYKPESEEQSDSSSDVSAINHCECNENEKINVVEEIEENWEISEDSAEDYDPTCENGKTRKKPWVQYSYTAAEKRGFLFNPSSSHPLSINEEIKNLKKRGLYEKYAETEVEGQFDDA